MIESWAWSILLNGGSFCAILYTVFLSSYRRVWSKLPSFELPDQYVPDISVTVLIPARNEAAHIIACLESIRCQDYPLHLLEVICIDDGSEDETAELVDSYDWPALHLIKRAGGGKKAALEQGVAAAAGELIVTTDADCIAPPRWLQYITGCYRRYEAAFIAAPVQFHREKNLLQRFQSLDLMGMMLLTGAGIAGGMHYLSNGANMAYPRSLFLEMGGYSENRRMASGDDIFLVQQMARRFPDRIVFLKHPEASVQTEAPDSWNAFWQQRLRWGAKNSRIRDIDLLLSLAQAFLLCWAIVICLLTLPWYGLKGFLLFAVLLGVKSFQDYHLLRQAGRYFGRGDLLRYFVPAQFLHITYFALVGLAANVQKTYTWKGRKLR